MRSPRWSLASLCAGLLSLPLVAQAPAPEHLLRFSLQDGAFYYRKAIISRPDGKLLPNTVELTLECKVSGSREGKADLQQTVTRVVTRARGPDASAPEVTYDTDAGGENPGLSKLIGLAIAMKIDDRARISGLTLPTEMAGAASPSTF